MNNTTTIAPIVLSPCPKCGGKVDRGNRPGRIHCLARGTALLAWLREQPREDRDLAKVPEGFYDGLCDWAGFRREYDVVAEELPALRERFAKIAKRAAKLGVTPPSFDVVGTFMFEWRDRNDAPRVTEKARIIVSGDRPRINGWSFVARIDHMEEGNVLSVGDRSVEIPAHFRTAPCVCEHCNLRRRRIATYMLHSDDGAWKQVGASCLTDFLGHPHPEAIAALAEFWGDIEDACDDAGDHEGGSGERRSDGYGMVAFMERVAQAIRLYGWTSRKTAEERSMLSTCSEALYMLNPPKTAPRPARPEPIDRERAAAAIEWARSLPEDCDDYLWNLRTAARREYVTRVTYGLMASALPAYDRSLAKRAQKHPSEWIGVVKVKGDRKYKAPTFRLTVDRVIDLQGEWGTSWINIMHDVDGNVVTWKTTTGGLDQGRTYDVTGTVEAHEVYRPRDAAPDFPGIRQTKLTRCKAVLVEEHAPAAEEAEAA